MDLRFWRRSQQKENAFVTKVVILAALFGFGAGVVGQMVSNVYLDPYLMPNDYSVNTDINSATPEIQKVKKFLGTNQDFLIDEVNQRLAHSLAGIYLKKPDSKDIIDNIYLVDELLANAFVLTSDGWLVASTDIFAKYKQTNLLVALNGKKYVIEQILPDKLTKVNFIKIPAQNLTPVVLGDAQELTLGQTVAVLNSHGSQVTTNINDLNYKSASKTLIRSSEEFYSFILLKDELTAPYASAVMVNLGGEVVGLVNSDLKTVMPINYFKSIVNNVLKQGLVLRALLGVKFIDLSESHVIGNAKGALIYEAPKKTTPAFQAELNKDDIILKVDGVPISEKVTLTQLIQEYKPGDDVELIILRDGTERKGDVVLGAVE